MHHPTDRIAHTTAFVTPVVEHWLEREIAQWVHPMKDRSDNPMMDSFLKTSSNIIFLITIDFCVNNSLRKLPEFQYGHITMLLDLYP